jgi:hypothetical protein
MGDNANYRMMEAVFRIRNIPRHQDPDMGIEVIELVDILLHLILATALSLEAAVHFGNAAY